MVLTRCLTVYEFESYLLYFLSKIVLIAVHGEASASMTNEGYQSLSQVAAEYITSLNYRDSFALIGFTENEKPSFVKQVCH